MSVSDVAVQVDSLTPESMCNINQCSRSVLSSDYSMSSFSSVEKLYSQKLAAQICISSMM